MRWMGLQALHDFCGVTGAQRLHGGFFGFARWGQWVIESWWYWRGKGLV